MNKPKPEHRSLYPPPYVAEDSNRIDINLIAMLLWQSLLTGIAVAVSHMGWYLPGAGPAEMGLQYGLICFGFLCVSMVLFHVGGVRDSLALRAEFSRENQVDKWQRQQARLNQRRANKNRYWSDQQQPANGYGNNQTPSQFGVPTQITTSSHDEEGN